MSASLQNTSPTTSRDRGRGSGRLWSPEEKRRIVEEAVRPGASVADVARRHGVNANLVFTWKRAAGAASASSTTATSSLAIATTDAAASPASSPEFMPIGIVAREHGGVPAEIDGDLPLAIASGRSGGASMARPGMDERPGMIEIDLVDGVRLRVDAFVNERALRRVLAVLKAAS
ncbi:MAG: transposase [Acetobacteraceae bacterium]|nr:transposase [Acetobacteraceae bacterium]